VTLKKKNELHPGLILKVTYPSGIQEFIKLIELEDVQFGRISSGEFGMMGVNEDPIRIQKMWRVHDWNRQQRQWKQNSTHHVAIFCLEDKEECRIVTPLERLIIFGG
jgi:hypothetical protein